MKITRRHDDRFNPFRSTEAAAKLLRSNYDQLGDWALAITAYNYGTGGISRAADLYEGDYSTMIERYQGPHFGFAVKNYYAEFLAAMDVYENEETYFPGIKYDVANLAATDTESEPDEEAPPRHSTRSHRARHHGAAHHHRRLHRA